MAHDMLHNHGNMHDGDDDQAGDDQNRAQPGDHHDRGDEAPIKFDQLDTVNYLHSDNKADGSAVEHFILQVDGFEQNGAHVTVPGLGSDFGMYFIIDATLAPSTGAPVFSSLNIALMVDPGNNDGAPSSTQAGGASFANGTGGDFALATGSLVSAALQLNADPVAGTRHANFVEQMTPTKAGLEALGGSLKAGDLLQELLTTLPGNFTSIPLPGGDSTVLVNGATGIAQLTPLKSLSLSVDDLSRDHGGSWSFAGVGH